MGLADAAGTLLGGDATGGAAPQITLAVDGKRYAGWLEIDIERSLDMLTDRFSLSYTDRWSDGGEPWAIREGAKAEVFFGDELLVTGWVNTAEWEVTGEERQLSSMGRSLSGDLEDCSAIHATGHWQNKSPLAIIKDLIAPYKMTVTSTAADSMLPINRFALQEGEYVKEAIDRLCESVALLPVSKPDGNLALIHANVPRGKVQKLPVETAIRRKVVTDDSNRFSNYYAIGQSWGNKNRNGEAIIKIRHHITDAGVTRHRPLVLIAEHSVAQTAQLKARATWERNVRAGRAMRYVAVFPTVLAPDGKAYTPGSHFIVKDEALGVDETLVLVSANIRADADNLVTEVELTLPAAYSVLEYPPKKKLNPKPKKPKPLEVCFPIDQIPAGFPGSGF